MSAHPTAEPAARAHGHQHAPGHGAPHAHEHPAHHIAGPSTTADEPRRPWTVFALMIAAQFMVILDVSVVNVALPSISDALHLSAADHQWTISAYVLLSGGLLLLGGRIADLLNRRRAFLAGVALFTAASLVSGLAQTPLTLILARAGQGAGAALLTPAALSIIMTAYAGRQRQTALAVWGTVGSLGIAAGVLFGGALTSALGWRAVFVINVPIGAAVVLGTLRAVAHGGSQPGALRRLDVPGALTLVAGLLALVFGIEATRSAGWTAPRTWLALAAAAILLAVFARLERRAADPLVPPATWRMRSLVSASAVMAGVTGVVVGAIFLSSLYLQAIVGASPVVAGLQFLPLAAAITLAAAAASKVIGRLGPRPLILGGLVVMAAGVLLLAAGAGGTAYAADVLPGFLLVGAGVGPMFVAIAVAAMSDVPADESGLASGLMMTGHEIGAALGVAALSAVAGDLATSAGLIDGYGRAFAVTAGVLGALFVLTALAVPGGKAATGTPVHGGHGHGH
ncbi:MFS transporter [Geodermatophilus obscurus]|uniref:Major facilitator superfamily MFS_1 n=1 Tax=Geodermatophilus obscurus (strain ATCC 25078 / DSM 43160 / JCM 3152 / CCUG 61914 / KCC A-0152 / KCTC 9177 / NBRC 13315 / NRRL B-3577 / G-20) TaxID=526225 RepID=D2SDB2_GEOOG|nr:MFS transporter [Geodermatophilus obscurus]ADB76461.1 major facilitator superfamily MFS_1 [Geodermatophilus obscurus DSM 43160]